MIYSKFILIMGAVSIIMGDFDEDLTCGSTEKCDCFDDFGGFEYQCPKNMDENGVVIHLRRDNQIKTDCWGKVNTIQEVLPIVNLKTFRELFLNSCPLNSDSFKYIRQSWNLKNLTALIVDGCRFSDGSVLSKKSFRPFHKLQYIQIRSSNLQNVDNRIFESLPNLIYVQLQNTSLELYENTFHFNILLQFVELSHHQDALPTAIFQKLTDLKQLHLLSNNIESITSDMFATNLKLTSLILDSNEIEHLHPDAFHTLHHLKDLIISNNKIANISRNHFSGCISLENIHLDHNSITTLKEYVFANLPHLKTINLRKSLIRNIEANVFFGSVSLTHLRLDNNEVEVLPNGLFDGLENLQVLNLGGNKIKHLDDFVFESLSNLKTLILQNNLLYQINGQLFESLVNLEEINLSTNEIAEIDNEAFTYNVNLKRLYISNNKYKYLVDDGKYFKLSPFSNCTHLEELDLENNLIEDMLEDVILYLRKIRYINLSRNRISALELISLWKLNGQKTVINLEYNNISWIGFENIHETMEEEKAINTSHHKDFATTVLVSHNPLNCDCFSGDLIRYVNNQFKIESIIDIVYDDLFCANPAHLKNQPVANLTLDLMICPLEEIVDKHRCTTNANCICSWRPFDKTLLVDCARKNITHIPNIYLPIDLDFNQTEIHLEYNQIVHGPKWHNVGYENATKLFLNNNRVKNLTWIPPNVKVLHLHNNSLEEITYQMLEQLGTSALKELSLELNPWKCDCSIWNLTNFIRRHIHQMNGLSIRCNTTRELLTNLNFNDICDDELLTLIIPIMVVTVILCFVSFAAAIFYKYQLELKVWLYGKGICLCLVQEEELDRDKEFDAFISYSHKDETFVNETLLPTLESEPDCYELCLHYRNWIPGESIAEQVVHSVLKSRRTLVVLSSNFMESVWGKIEFRTAHAEAMNENRARVIVLLYGDIDINSLDEELKTYLKTNTYIKWGDPWFWKKLRYALPKRNRNVSPDRK